MYQKAIIPFIKSPTCRNNQDTIFTQKAAKPSLFRKISPNHFLHAQNRPQKKSNDFWNVSTLAVIGTKCPSALASCKEGGNGAWKKTCSDKRIESVLIEKGSASSQDPRRSVYRAQTPSPASR